MQGDVFGWGLGDPVQNAGGPGQNVAAGISGRNSPSAGWDPWTKRAASVGRIRRFWCWAWHDRAWWASVQFIIGSYIYVYGAVGEGLRAVEENDRLKPWMLTWPYMAAAVLFTGGSAILLKLSLEQHPDIIDHQAERDMDEHDGGDHSDSSQEGDPPPVTKFLGKWTVARDAGGEAGLQKMAHTESDRQELVARAYLDTPLLFRVADPGYRRRWWLDFSGSLVLLLGSAVYNISCGMECVKAVRGDLPDWGMDVNLWFVTMPNVIAGSCFVGGSWLYYAACTGTASLLIWRPYSTTWWIAALNFWGSAAYWVGAFCQKPVLQFAPHILVANWAEIFVGYFLGSLVMLVASHLMVMRIASDLAAEDATMPVPQLDVEGGAAGRD
ncbi:hypothetical protein WJX72_005426 [[Myrmecia] bisecta]|uniref:Uncharacterized protein n=1 Tax=[Myrmecia] bisecta TaxID=41462 RepID=A0AAW1PVU1_9CHLO